MSEQFTADVAFRVTANDYGAEITLGDIVVFGSDVVTGWDSATRRYGMLSHEEIAQRAVNDFAHELRRAVKMVRDL